MTKFARGGGMALAGMLVGLGIALFAKAVYLVGFHKLTVEHIMGVGLVLVGLLRLRMQRIISSGYGRRGGVDEVTIERDGGEHGDTP